MMWSEEYQAELVRGHLDVAARKDFVAGMYTWNFADFAAVPSPGRGRAAASAPPRRR